MHTPVPPSAQPKTSHKALWITLASIGAFLVLVCGVGAVFLKGVGDAVDEAGKPNAVASHHGAAADAGAPTDEATDEPEPRPTGSAALKMGDQLQLSQDGVDGSADGTVTVKSVKRYTGPVIEYGEGPQHGQFLVFEVAVKGGSGKFDFSPDDFYIRDASGSRYETGGGNSYEAIDGDPITYTTLNTGEHVSGPLPFDAKNPHGTLVYDPNLSGEPLAEWSF